MDVDDFDDVDEEQCAGETMLDESRTGERRRRRKGTTSIRTCVCCQGEIRICCCCVLGKVFECVESSFCCMYVCAVRWLLALVRCFDYRLLFFLLCSKARGM